MNNIQASKIIPIISLAVVLIVIVGFWWGGSSDVKYKFSTANEYYVIQSEDPEGLGKGGILGGLLIPDVIPSCATDIKYSFDINKNQGSLLFNCADLDVETYAASIDAINAAGLPWQAVSFDGQSVELVIRVPVTENDPSTPEASNGQEQNQL